MSKATDELETAFIKVDLDYAPKTNGKKFKEWCIKHSFYYIGPGRRAWCSSLGTYLRDASGVAYNDGEPFLFYDEDLDEARAAIQAMVNAEITKVLDRLEQKRETCYDCQHDNHTLDDPEPYVPLSAIQAERERLK